MPDILQSFADFHAANLPVPDLPAANLSEPNCDNAPDDNIPDVADPDETDFPDSVVEFPNNQDEDQQQVLHGILKQRSQKPQEAVIIDGPRIRKPTVRW